jgi:hypothetical protein
VTHPNVAEKIQRWRLVFNASWNGLDVESFLYRVKSLRVKTLDSNFNELYDNCHLLFEEEATKWYWNFVKRNRRGTWFQLRQELTKRFSEDRDHDEVIRELYGR